MNVALMKHVYARTFLAAFIAFLIVSGVVIGYVSTRPPTYQARIAIIASPVDVKSSNADFSAVVSLTMAGVGETARSASVLAKAVSGVPNAPSPDVLADRVTVELVPGSGVARVSVTADSASQTSVLTRAVGAGIVNADLLRPVGIFRLVDTRAPQAYKIAPDLTLALGFGMTAGLLAAVLAGAAMLIFRPRVSTRNQTLSAIGDPLIPVIELNSEAEIKDMAALLGASSKLLLVPAGSAAWPATTTLKLRLQTGEEIPTADALVFVIVKRGVTTPVELRNAVSLVMASGGRLNGVILASISGTRPSSRSADPFVTSVTPNR
jgi:capsular polysaccharide biosynthesis protein